MSDGGFGYTLRNLARGFVGAGPETGLGLLGLTGWERAQQANARLSRDLNQLFGTPDMSFTENPGASAAQVVGGAMLGLPRAAVAGATAAVANLPRAARVAVGALEAATPLTLPLTPGRVALNAGVGGAAAYGVERLGMAANGTDGERVDLDADPVGAPVDLDAPAPTRPTAPAGTRPELAPAGRNAPPVEGEPIDLDGEAIDLDAAPTQLGSSAARTAMEYLPGVMLGLIGTAGVAGAVRNARVVRAADTLAAAPESIVRPGPVELPDVARPSIAEQAETNIFSSSNPVRQRFGEEVNAGRMTPERADELVGLAEIGLNQTVRSQAVDESMRTGLLPGGVQAPPLTNIADRVAVIRNASPERAQILSEGLAAADELDARRRNFVNGNYQSGRAPDEAPTGARTMLADRSDTELERLVRLRDADPELAAVTQEVRAFNRALIDMSVNEGAISAREGADMLAANPNYIHRLFAETRAQQANQGARNISTTDVTSNSPFTARNMGEGTGPNVAQDPIMSTLEGARQSIEFVIANRARREIATALAATVDEASTGPQFVGRVMRDGQPHNPAFIPVKYRGPTGERLQIELEPSVAAVFAGAPKVAVPFMNGMRKWMQNFTTGPGAAVLGTVFAPTSASMSGVATVLNRPAGTTAGLLDRALSTISGGRAGVRGDPTFALQAAHAIVADTAALAAETVSNTLRRSILSNGTIARFMGAEHAERIATAAQRAYEDSMLHVMRREGAAGAGLSYAPEHSLSFNANIARMSPEYAATLPYAGRAADISNIRTYDDLVAFMERTSGRAVPPTLRRTWNVISNVLDIIASSPQSAFFRQNVDTLGPGRAAAVSRRIAGDPAQYGASPAVQRLTSVFPYSNVMLQSLHSYGRTIRREPIAFAAGAASFITLTQMASIYSAMQADEALIANGEQPVNMQTLVLQPTREQVGAISIFLPGGNPNVPLQLRYDPNIAPAVAMGRRYLLGLLGADDPRFYMQEFDALRNGFSALLDQQMAEGLRTGVGMAAGQLSVPPLIDAGASAVLGVDVGNALDLTNPRIYAPRDIGAPGYEMNRLPNDNLNRYLEAGIEAMFGSSATVITETIRTLGMADDPVRGASAGYVLNAQSSNRMIAPLFQAARQMPVNDSVGELVRPIEDSMARITAGISGVRAPATIGSGNMRQEPEFGPGRAQPDESMVPVLEAVASFNSSLQQDRQRRKLLSEQILNIRADPVMRSDPTAMRTRINEYAAELRRVNAEIYDKVQEFQQSISAGVGRRVVVADIQPLRPITQFAPLQ